MSRMEASANSLRAATRHSSLNSRSSRTKLTSSFVFEGLREFGGELRKHVALLRRCTARRAAANETLDLASRLEQLELLLNVDFGYQQTPLRHNQNQVLARQTLDCLANRRAPNTGHFAQEKLGHCRARRNLQGNDRFPRSARKLAR